MGVSSTLILWGRAETVTPWDDYGSALVPARAVSPAGSFVQPVWGRGLPRLLHPLLLSGGIFLMAVLSVSAVQLSCSSFVLYFYWISLQDND